MTGRTNIKNRLIMAMFLLAMGWTTAVGEIIYVDADAPGANNGSSWSNAYNYLQDALADANSAAKPVEIRVAQGTYKPDQGIGITTGDREATFQLINGVTLKGSYAGFGELDPNVRDIEEYETILSGDLAGNDVEVNDPCDLLTETTRAENSYHVVTASEKDANNILDGFTITGGNANEAWPGQHRWGGGICNDSTVLTLVSCTLRANSAGYGGGGMDNFGGRPILTNCTFSSNSAGYGGGGLYNQNGSAAKLTNCTFSGNSGTRYGGAMWNSDSNVGLSNCRFSGNVSCYGGGIGNVRSSLTLTKCIFSGNSALGYGGGGLSDYGSNMTIINCMFDGNSAKGMHGHGGGIRFEDSSLSITNSTFSGNLAVKFGGGIYCPFPPMPCAALSGSSAGLAAGPLTFTIDSCILSGNSDSGGSDESAQLDVYIPPVLNYSCIQGWTGTFGGIGNIGADPCFADPCNGDYHLKSQAGRWEPNGQSWVQDDVASPCIDTGDISNPVGNEPFPNGGIINIGAYGGTAEASKSYFGEPVCEIIVAGDLNGDCKVNFLDFRLMALHWLEVKGP